MEVWKDVKGYEGFYQVSNMGNVKSLKRTVPHPRSKVITYRERIMRPSDTNGYKLLRLSRNGTSTHFLVHRLVAMHFLHNTKNSPEVNHIDYDRSNNKADNLEWCTSHENKQHSADKYRGSNNGTAILKEAQVVEIKSVLSNQQRPTYLEISSRYGVSAACIQKIASNKIWRHI